MGKNLQTMYIIFQENEKGIGCFKNISQRKLICSSACLIYQEPAKVSSLGELRIFGNI